MEQKAIQMIEELAKQLGVAAEHVYTVFTKQMIIEGWTFIGMVAIFTLLFAAATILLIKKADDIDETPLVFCGVLLLCADAITIGTWFFVGEAIQKIHNPEYWAMKEIIKAVTGD
ncbi:hypothetical protein [Bacillus wiedmannii]|uniref:hypothetical protein n=1 Tax=Bacillus wiedmannii TaxID=1890302 RepID=UPI000BF1D8F6|nr:hypothetical protein [Bacillus wiedmannii]PEM08545.1 hypothetical protein CN610_20040 [Bacillus wiedmannii]